MMTPTRTNTRQAEATKVDEKTAVIIIYMLIYHNTSPATGCNMMLPIFYITTVSEM